MKQQIKSPKFDQGLQNLKSLKSITNKDALNLKIDIDNSTIYHRKINIDGTYDYVNHQLSVLCGYDDYELIGKTYKKILHADMPKVIYDILKERLNKGLPIQIVEKFQTKKGYSFWLLSLYESKINQKGDIVFHTIKSVKVAEQTLTIIKKLYNSLKRIEEKTGDNVASKRFLIGFLENHKHTYNSFMNKIIDLKTNDNYKLKLQKIIKEKIKESIKTPKKTSLLINTHIQKSTLNNHLRIMKKGA